MKFYDACHLVAGGFQLVFDIVIAVGDDYHFNTSCIVVDCQVGNRDTVLLEDSRDIFENAKLIFTDRNDITRTIAVIA